MDKQKLTIKQRTIITLSMLILSSSVFLNAKELFEKTTNYRLDYEYINIKDMAKTSIPEKKESDSIIKNTELFIKLKEQTPPTQDNSQANNQNKKIWYLPTEVGKITQNPSYWHFAHDITSYRGTGEVIHPIANGTISGMYRDSAGAIIVTVLHNINGKYYTSQYVHLSRYANGIYVGMPVTVNDSLGQMGSTGNSTGVHLHIAVLDCALFSENDPNCKTIGDWYNYGRKRYSEGFYGLWSLIDVPAEWYSR